jgi:hypothetical protein
LVLPRPIRLFQLLDLFFEPLDSRLMALGVFGQLFDRAAEALDGVGEIGDVFRIPRRGRVESCPGSEQLGVGAERCGTGTAF